MSEVVYVNYLKNLNTKLIDNDINLNLDFELGSSHIIEQLSVLEQYLLLNNIELQDNKGLNSLLGFNEITEDAWWLNYRKEREKTLKRIKQKNVLFTLGTKAEFTVIPFDINSIEDVEDEIEEITETNIEDSPVSTEETDLFDVGQPSDSLFEDDSTDLFAEDENDTDEPLLTDIFNDLQKAQHLFDVEDDYEFHDEYTLVDDEEESAVQEEDNTDLFADDDTEVDLFADEDKENTEFDTNNSFGADNSFGDSAFGEEFTFEQPQMAQPQGPVVKDAMVDKTSEVINKGLNALLKKIAK